MSAHPAAIETKNLNFFYGKTQSLTNVNLDPLLPASPALLPNGTQAIGVDIPRYLGMHQAGILPVDKLRTHTLKLADINEGFDRLAQGLAVRQIIDFGS